MRGDHLKHQIISCDEARHREDLARDRLDGGMLYPLLLSLPMASALLMRPVVTPRTVVAMQYGGGQQQGYGGQIDGQIAAEPPAERQFDGHPVASPATLLHPHTDFAQATAAV